MTLTNVLHLHDHIIEYDGEATKFYTLRSAHE